MTTTPQGDESPAQRLAAFEAWFNQAVGEIQPNPTSRARVRPQVAFRWALWWLYQGLRELLRREP